MRASGLHVVERKLTVIELQPGRLSDYGRFLLRDGKPMAGGASKSDYLENKNLDHNLGKSAFTMPTTVALALCTVVPTDASTGSSITEASYTGYARKVVAASDLNAAASGQSTNANVLTFAACTSGSSTVIGAALCDSSTTGAGNVLYWFTATSTVVSTTQTPATIAATTGLIVNED
jgi:hypothetical protein